MSLTKRSAEMLIDLVEIKLSFLEVSDREDAREFRALQAALRELQALLGRKPQLAGLVAPQQAPAPSLPAAAHAT